MTRKAVPLSDDEINAIERARHGRALVELAGQGAIRSESAALHALVLLGLEAVNQHVQVEGYAALAASMDDEDRAFEATMRGRRRGGEA